MLVQLLLVATGAIVFSLAFPSFVSKWGWAPLAYVALIPVAVVVHRARWPEVFAFGFLYGLTTYIIHNYWLGGFHPLAVLLVPLIYATYFLMLFPMLKLADTLMPRYGYLLQVAMWMSYEYMRTQAFLGYSYGIIGYSQYLFLPLVRLSSLTGVWGVSLLVVFPSFYLGAGLRDGWRALPAFLRAHRVSAIAWAVAFVLAIGYGIATRVDYSEAPTWRVALIQQNADPWVGGYPAYRRSLDISTRLSREALQHNPDVVVWSETSVVPPIDFHMRFRTSRESHEIVSDLIAFLDDQDTPFIIGNSSARFLRGPSGEPERIDYNAVIVHHNGQFTEPYRKVHLVPFTEHFPYRRQFPWLYDMLMDSGSNHWGHGDEFTVFEIDGIRFSTPICFEDTFGYLTREFARNGADIFVNLTNDLWSRSVAASMQHMIMAVFRATETRRTMVRSTNGGMTTIIDPNGRILDLYPPFVEGYLIGDAPLYVGPDSLYLLWGDWLAYVMLVIAFAGVFVAAFFAVRRDRAQAV
ncbi:MAG: apolipoprotein N-acyltransferase [Spirochaetaceae bacterium]|nr:MAG: apolipoprotein N-acyltransferase [Spirochaetaceae bacterium]